MEYCPKCSYQKEESAKFCAKCGKEFALSKGVIDYIIISETRKIIYLI